MATSKGEAAKVVEEGGGGEKKPQSSPGGEGDDPLVAAEKKAEEIPSPPPEPDTIGMYTVWAIPPDYIASLHLVMTQLSEMHAGPSFQPHVTVLDAHPVLRSKAQESLKDLCATTLPYTYKITGVKTGQDFHQCVYLTIESTQEVRRSSSVSFYWETNLPWCFISFFLHQTSLLASVPEEHAISISISHARSFCRDRFFWLFYGFWHPGYKISGDANDTNDFFFSERTGPSRQIMRKAILKPSY
jgi:hypothetical protein